MNGPLARAFSLLIFAVAWLTAYQNAHATATEPEVVAQLAHISAISSVAVTPDGRQVVSASYDHTIKLWDMATGALIRNFDGQQAELYSVAVTPDGRHIVSGSGDDTLRVWDIATGALLRSIACQQGAVVSVAMTPDGRHIVSAGHVGSIKLWDFATGALVLSVESHQGVLTSMALTPDGRFIVSGGNDGTIKLWELATGKLVRSVGGWFVNHQGPVSALAVTPDGRSIVSGSGDTTVKLWDMATGDLVRSFEGHEYRVNAVAVTLDGRTIVSESEDVIKLWDLSTGALVQSIAGQDWAHAIVVARDGLHAVLAGDTMRLLDLAAGKVVDSFESQQGSVNAISMTPDGRQVVSGNGDKSLRLWDLASGALVRSFTGHQDQVLDVTVTPDGQHIVSGSADHSTKLWNLATGDLERTFTGHRFNVSAVAVTHDGRHIVSGSGDNSIKIWDLATGALLRDIESQQQVILSIAVTRDDRHFVSMNYLGQIALWDLATGALVNSWDSNGHAMALTPDGRHVVSAGNAGSIDIWDLATGALVLSFGDQGDVRRRADSVAVSPDGRYIVSGSSESTQLWDFATGALVKSFEGRQGPVKAMGFSPDGRLLIAGGSDGVLRIWNRDNGHALASLVGRSDGGALVLTPHGFFAMDGESKGASYLKVVDRLDVYDVRQFYQALYRPELVSELLRGDPEGKYEIAAGELNLRKILDSGPAPRLQLKRTERIGDKVRVTVEIDDQGGGIGKIEWRVDDVLLDGERAMTPLGGDEGIRTEMRSFPLTASGNVISVTAYNKAGLITAVPVVEKVDGRGITEADKSRLHILAVGIDDYAQSSLQLRYAVNDARAFSAKLKRAAEELGLFKSVSVTTLFNAEVTKVGLDRAFAELAAQIGPEDKFVFFAAGHGKVYRDRYYFFPQDLRFGAGDAITSQGIDQDTWQTWFSRIPATASVLIYDTCEAGKLTTAMRGNESIRTAIDLLKHATGRSILAATTAEDAAREGLENHGVFTYALLKALSEGDQNGDGRIEVIELGQYVERMVPELTEERWGIAQRPRFTIQANFPIASSVAPDDGEAAFIPKAATHVIIKQVTVAVADRGAAADKVDLKPGTTVRLLKSDGDRALIARDGQELGFVPSEALAPLN